MCPTRCGVYAVSGQHLVLRITFPSEQFKLFKEKHADCDVTKVSTEYIYNLYIYIYIYIMYI